MPHDPVALVLGWIWACGAAATIGCLGFLTHEATHQDQTTAQPALSAPDATQHDAT